jgi:hypothetical protein
MVENDHGILPGLPRGESEHFQVRIRLISCAAMELPSLPIEIRCYNFEISKNPKNTASSYPTP